MRFTLRPLLASLVLLAVATGCDSGDPSAPDPPDDPDPVFTRGYFTGLDVTAFPAAAPDGSGWDVASAPDLFWVIRTTGGEEWARGTVLNDVPVDSLPALWRVSGGGFQFEDLDRTFEVVLFDADDLTADDEMGVAGRFAPADFLDDAPEEIPLAGDGVRLAVQTRWE